MVTQAKNGLAYINGFFVPYTETPESLRPRGGMSRVVHFWEAYATREEALECIRRIEAGEGNLPGGFPVNNVGEKV
jgi:hypothetical protein